MSTLPKCPHGMARDDGRYVGVWAAPFDECRCCGVNYPYIDSGSWGPDGSSGRSWTKGLCADCGGHYVAWRVAAEDGMTAHVHRPDPRREALRLNLERIAEAAALIFGVAVILALMSVAQ